MKDKITKGDALQIINTAFDMASVHVTCDLRAEFERCRRFVVEAVKRIDCGCGDGRPRDGGTVDVGRPDD